ncbi:hypothetical protein, partial [Cecembia sp.]|uniref:hypothetical protein n=1 Tax=Cecembia sp. TaxID=1898110 RepID=UPI0025BBF06F
LVEIRKPCANSISHGAGDLINPFEIPQKHQTQRISVNQCNSSLQQAGVDSHLRIENPRYRIRKF